TGYRVNFRFLPAELGRGRGWEFGLYRRVLSPHTPTLAFVGVLEPGPGLLEVVELQARWLGEVLAGRLAVPPAAQMWRAIDAGGERRSAAQFGQTGPHTLLCNRHAYLGVLGRDLRAAGRRSRRRRASAGLRQRWCPPGGGRGARDLAPERGSA
ncbi:MAG TPA: hypothetical protein VHX88_15725, partial [Solirubrobacteraceae bacterium]|nr:hypothetical protein [Solirubrobacteraceae bacterium]